jgi:YD repeat-containing protein
VQQLNPDGGTLGWVYDAAGDVVAKIDALNHLTVNDYDQRDWLTGVTEDVGDLNRTSQTAYDVAGNATLVTDARGTETFYVYDTMHRVTLEIDAVNRDRAGGWRALWTDYDYDGRVTSVIDGRGIETVYRYDALGRKVSTLEAANVPGQSRLSTMAYDQAGNLSETTDGLKHKTHYFYDDDNRQTGVIEAYGEAFPRTTRTFYDQVGNVIGTAGGRSILTQYVYDAANRKTAMTAAFALLEPDGSMTALSEATTTCYAYDPAGNLTQVISGQSNRHSYAHPSTTLYEYDPMNRRTLERDMLLAPSPQYPLGVASGHLTLYDTAGQATLVEDALGVLTRYGYDGLGRQTLEVDAWGTSQERTIWRSYDLNDNLIATDRWQNYDAAATGADLEQTLYGYDYLDRQTSTTAAAGSGHQRSTETLYDADSNVTGTIDARGVGTSYAFDALNRNVEVIVAASAPAWLPVLSQTSWALYDADNNVTWTMDARGTQTSYRALTH